MTATIEPQSALARLLVAYAPPAFRARARLVWAFDERLAALVRTTTEPMIGQMRIAWWDEVLDDASGAKGSGDPLVDALRGAGLTGAPGLRAMLDGWEALIDAQAPDGEALSAFAVGRGGGLFAALAGDGEAPDWLTRAGALWALWDLSGHVRDPAEQSRAVAAARAYLPEGRDPWARAWKPMRLATGLARHDVMAGRAAPAGLTPGQYVRLLRLALTGR